MRRAWQLPGVFPGEKGQKKHALPAGPELRKVRRTLHKWPRGSLVLCVAAFHAPSPVETRVDD